MDPVLPPTDPVLTKTDNQPSKKRYQCDTCPKQFDIYSTYYSHKTSHTPKKIQCKSCQKPFKNMSCLYKHHYHSHSETRTNTRTDTQTENAKPETTTIHRSKLSTRILDL